MHFRTSLTLIACASLAVVGLAYTGHAADVATTMPSTMPTRPMTKAGKPKSLTLVKPWKDVKDLTDDQKIQIYTIHQETKEKIDALMAEEQTKCMALLTDAQKASLNDTMGAEKVAAKKADAK